MVSEEMPPSTDVEEVKEELSAGEDDPKRVSWRQVLAEAAVAAV